LRPDPASGLKYFIVKRILNSFPAIICVNADIYKKILNFGVKKSRLEIISPYISPRNFEEDIVDEEVRLFLENRSPVLVANVTKFVRYKGFDLYGSDMYIELASYLVRNFPNIGFVVSLSMINDPEYYDLLLKSVHGKNLENHLVFFKGTGELSPLILKADLLIRATNSDSYGMSIAEALELGIPAIASDVVKRPKGTILFETRDQEDLNRTTLKTLNEIEKYKELIRNSSFGSETVEKIKMVYLSVVTKSKEIGRGDFL
jgi:glycosyltransferase involved in cell wall biosynthesis